MKVSFESKGDFEVTAEWLKKAANMNPSIVLKQIANDGSKSLAANTPKDTGETASSWTGKIESKGDISELSWVNTAHPEANVNVAKVIELGHGTGTGGYVSPRPYIKDAMKPIWSDIDKRVVKELIK